MNRKPLFRSSALLYAALSAAALASAQTAPATARPQPPQIVSPEIQPDRHVTFRIHAPHAEAVQLMAYDIPGNNQGAALTKGDNGVWEVTLGPIDPGAYRYSFNVDGVMTVDPHNPETSESNNNTWSLFDVPGADFMDTKNVPHGAVAAVTYYSTALGRFRRMHIYTPPGYESGSGKLPVFYLLHGAGDSDDSWPTVGRAGFIMDNLIAAGKAKPMIVVMPAGHTSRTGFSMPTRADDFNRDFLDDIMPYVEKNYRVQSDRAHRAIAGLSMGGAQTLNIAVAHLNDFAYIGVFSSGLFTMFPAQRPGAPPAPAATGPNWEEQNLANLDNATYKKGLKLFWFGTGREDFLIDTSRKTVALLKTHGFNVEFHESAGAHTWTNWRDYLDIFAPQLFQ
jgi:enterochelin esterase family protein